MIVYGDPQYEKELNELLEQLRSRLAALAAQQPGKGALSLEQLREALIFAGQVEQAVDDAVERGSLQDAGLVSALHNVTAQVANSFYRRWSSTGDSVRARSAKKGLELALLSLAAAVRPPAGEVVTVKVPEGFAFYALYPEQYCHAASRWLEDHAGDRQGRAVVVGIRSIGTTLAAVVTAALGAAGWHVHSLTVRPKGHPFRRYVEIGREKIDGAVWGLVVDEGPGLSGSSMVAVGQALARAGLPRERISFFPAHGGEPGDEASEEVRAWWGAAPRYVSPLDEVRFGGVSLARSLADATSALVDPGGASAEVEYLGGGEWRKIAYPDASEWPPVCAAFEHPKYRCVTPSGESMLWKFAGLAVVKPHSATAD